MSSIYKVCPTCGQNLDCEKWLIEAKQTIDKVIGALETARNTIIVLQNANEQLANQLGLQQDLAKFSRTDGGLIIPQA